MELMLHVREKTNFGNILVHKKDNNYKLYLKSSDKQIRVNRIFRKMRKQKKKTSTNIRESGKTIEIMMSGVIENGKVPDCQ